MKLGNLDHEKSFDVLWNNLKQNEKDEIVHFLRNNSNSTSGNPKNIVVTANNISNSIDFVADFGIDFDVSRRLFDKAIHLT